MENVVVHIISHSHWDREWYLPLKAIVCSWWNCLTISLISLKMTLSSRVSTWMDKLLSLTTTYKFALKIVTRSNATLTRANLKLVPLHLAG